MSAVHGVYARSRESRDFRLLQINKMKDNLIQYAKECEIAAEESVKKGSVPNDSKLATDTDKPLSSEEFEWNVENELLFLNAMMGHKPVGVNKHFSMMIILLKFEELMNRSVESQVLWDRLNTMYNMEMLHDAEILPFPNVDSEFVLPEEEYVELKKAKLVDPIDLKVEAAAEVETVPEPKRELKRELQVYKGMKDIRKEATSKDVKETAVKAAATEQSPAESTKDASKTEEVEVPSTASSPKKSRPSTPHEKKPTKEAKKDVKVSTPASKERKPSGSEKEVKPATTKTRTSVGKKETPPPPPARDDKSELRKDRIRELTASGGPKRSTRGSITDSASNKSASPVTTLSNKRKRT